MLQLDTPHFTQASGNKEQIDDDAKLAPEKIVVEKEIEKIKDSDEQTNMSCTCQNKYQPLSTPLIKQPIIPITNVITDNQLTNLTKRKRKSTKNIFTMNKFKKKK